MTESAYVIETDRIGLRPFHERDATALARIFDDPYAARFYPTMSDPLAAASWIAKNRGRYETDGVGLWAACLKATGELVGDCGLILQTVETRREVEVAYHLRADYRGQGLATEAARACLDYGFAQRGSPRVVSMVHPDNEASKRVAQRLHTRSRRFHRLGERYHLFYTERHDWPGLRAQPHAR